MTNRPHRTTCTQYKHAPAVSDIICLAVHAAQSHDFVNDTMSLSSNGTKTSLDHHAMLGHYCRHRDRDSCRVYPALEFFPRRVFGLKNMLHEHMFGDTTPFYIFRKI